MIVARGGGAERIVGAQMGNVVVGTVVHVTLVVLLIRGLVRIAQPPKPLTIESDAPYR